MANFKNAFMVGLNSAKKAQNNISEINEVINAMSAQLLELTDGKARLDISHFYEDPNNPLNRFSSDAKTYTALAISNADGKDSIEIAQWTRHENGYPCTITSDSGRFYCTNKIELENSIAELFTLTRTGKVILSKMNN